MNWCYQFGTLKLVLFLGIECISYSSVISLSFRLFLITMSWLFRATGWGWPASWFLYCDLLLQWQIWGTLCSWGEEWKRKILLFWWQVWDLWCMLAPLLSLLLIFTVWFVWLEKIATLLNYARLGWKKIRLCEGEREVDYLRCWLRRTNQLPRRVSWRNYV